MSRSRQGAQAAGRAPAGRVPTGARRRRRYAAAAKTLRPRQSRDRASGTVEAVIIVPALMLILLVFVQYALWAHASSLVQAAAAQGDQAARASGGTPAAGIVAAEQFLHRTGAEVIVGPVVRAHVQAGNMARVDVAGDVESILPGVHIGVSATSIGPVQTFRRSG